MALFMVVSDYFSDGIFGSYTNLKTAREDFELFLMNETTSWKDCGNYHYQFTNKNGKVFDANIVYDTIKMEDFNNMKCPNCGNEISEFEVINTEWFTGKYYDYIVGTCENCEKTYSWTEVFTYSHNEDITEINPADFIN